MAAATGATQVALGSDIRWVGYQAGPPYIFRSSASWFHGDQWFNYLVPGAGDNAIFDGQFDPQGNQMPTTVYFGDFVVGAEPPAIPTSFTVDGGHAFVNQLRFEHGDFTFRFADGNGLPQGSLTTTAQLIIADLPSSTASLTVRDGRLTTGSVVHIAPGATSNGAITVSGTGAEWIVNAWVDLGWVGQGALRVLDGASARISNNVYAGIRDASAGEIEVDGGGQLHVDGAIVLGSGHESTGDTHGSLVLEGTGSLVRGGNVYVGAGGTGMAFVRDGSTLRSGGVLGIGAGSGACSLVASRGALVEAASVRVGANQSSRNNVIEFHGAGTELRSAGNLDLGAFGSAGHLVVSQGARAVVTEDVYLGVGTSSEGTAVIDGASSALLARNVFVSTDGASASVQLRGGGSIVVTDSVRVRSGGSLSGNGLIVGKLVNEGGLISPGLSPGALSVEGSIELWSSSVTHMELGGNEPDLFDRLIVTGNASLSGTLVLDFVENFEPMPGTGFELISVSGLTSGSFHTFDIRGIDESRVTVDLVGGSLFVNVIPDPSVSSIFGLVIALVSRRRRANPV